MWFGEIGGEASLEGGGPSGTEQHRADQEDGEEVELDAAEGDGATDQSDQVAEAQSRAPEPRGDHHRPSLRPVF
jgi:hypothetical protein